MSEEVFTIAEAARYCNVTNMAIRQAFRHGGGQLVELASPHQHGPRVIQGVRRRDLDALRAAGFLNNRPGRRKNYITRRKVLANNKD